MIIVHPCGIVLDAFAERGTSASWNLNVQNQQKQTVKHESADSLYLSVHTQELYPKKLQSHKIK